MNVKEKRAALVAELQGLVDDVKAGDEASIKRADDIVAELEGIDEHLAKAAEKADTLAKLGETAKTTHKGVKMSNEVKSLGGAAVEAIKKAGLTRGAQPGTAVAEFKAATDTIVEPVPGDIQISDRVVTYPNGALYVRDLFPTEFVSAPTIGFYQITTEGTADTVAEDGAKPQLSADGVLKTVALTKVAGIMKITDEMLEDYPRLVSAIDRRGVYAKDLAVEDQLINGTGTAPDMTGLLAGGINTATWANGGDSQAIAEAIYNAAMNIKLTTGYDADGVIINPADWAGIRLAKDGNDQYFGGGFFEGQYGTNFGGLYPELWGMRVAISAFCPQGTIIVGAFRQASALAIKGGTRVETGYDGADFSHDRITLRVEERLALEIFEPQAFYALTEAK